MICKENQQCSQSNLSLQGDISPHDKVSSLSKAATVQSSSAHVLLLSLKSDHLFDNNTNEMKVLKDLSGFYLIPI